MTFKHLDINLYKGGNTMLEKIANACGFTQASKFVNDWTM